MIRLLQKWLSGEWRKADEEKLAKMAGEDPFLAEAWEGYRQFPQSDHEEKIRQIKARLRRSYGNKKTGIIFLLPRLAAATVVLVLAGFAVFTWIRPAGQLALQETTGTGAPEPPIVADQERPDPELMPATDLTPTIGKPEKPEREKPDAQALKPATREGDLLAEVSKNEIPEEALSEATPTISKEEVETRLPESLRSRPSMPTSASDVSVPAPAPVMVPVLDQAGKGPRTVSGIIADENGYPLIGANVLAPGYSTGTVTGIDGRFSMQVDSSVKQLIVNYTGFQSTAVPVEKTDTVFVRLAEGIALQETVVTGFAKESRRADSATPKMKKQALAQPENGFDALEKYLKKNLRYPEAARKAKIQGEVRVEFHLSPDGSLSRLRIVKSLGYGCDEEAIRLLREGPRWKAGPDQPVVYSIYFQL